MSSPAVDRLVRHRGGLGIRVRTLTPAPDLFARLGGREVVARTIEGLYDRIETDPALEPKFTNDTRLEREKQAHFFEEWLGGQPGWSSTFAGRGLTSIHGHIHISAKDADRWLGHFAAALEGAGVAADLRKETLATLRPLAKALVNESHEATRHEHRCHRGKPGDLAAAAAHKGKSDDALGVLSTEAAREEWGPEALFAAAGRGRLETVRALLDAGVDPNRAAPTDWGAGRRTPLYAARLKQRTEVEALLRERGAVDDVFTAAALGQLEEVEAWLEREPGLLDAADPAEDVYRLTPLHHATFAGQAAVALRLLERGAEVGPLGPQLLRSAAEDGEVALVRALLERGADAARIGPGRWVLHPELAPLLREAGADVNFAPTPHSSWIWDACTGNHAQKDDAEYVRALLAHGADVTADYGWRRSALHLAAKAGFVETVRALLEAGADPNQPDGRDAQTPLFYAFKAGKRVDPTVVATLLLEHGADPAIPDRIGKTVAQRSRAARAFLADRVS